MNKTTTLSCLAIAAALSGGCASITDGTSQTIIFNLDPREARCVATREGETLGTVSGRINTLTVGKGARDIVVDCQAEGYRQQTQRLVSKTQAAGVVGGIFLDLGIVDMMTGAMWKYPTDVSISLEKILPMTTPAAASQSTLAPQPVAAPQPAVAGQPATAPAQPAQPVKEAAASN